jgi:hypothetical protein
MILIRFTADHSFVSQSILWRTDGVVSHVEYLIVDRDLRPESTFGARLNGGICHRPYTQSFWEQWYSFDGIDESYSEALRFDGRKYDWRDIVQLLVGRHPNYYDPTRAICSILVGYSNRIAWAKGDAPALINPEVPTWQMTPQLLYGAVKNIVVHHQAL